MNFLESKKKKIVIGMQKSVPFLKKDDCVLEV